MELPCFRSMLLVSTSYVLVSTPYEHEIRLTDPLYFVLCITSATELKALQ